MKLQEFNHKINIAKIAAQKLINISHIQRAEILLILSKKITKNANEILIANKKDILRCIKNNISQNFIERLTLDKNSITAISESLVQISKLPDYIGKVVSNSNRPSGINIKKIIYPLGLVAMIYESRPNVTIDAFALCFKSGNGVILKAGDEIKHTNLAIIKIIKSVLNESNIDSNFVVDFTGLERGMVKKLIRDNRIDCLIPRGGKGLINFVKNNTTIPTIITGASVVHTYVDDKYDSKIAQNVIVNAKTRRVSICNALDVLVIHKKSLSILIWLTDSLQEKNIEIRADNTSYKILKDINYQNLKKAKSIDFDTEFLDNILAVKVVNNFNEAINHIQKHSLGHSEAIISSNKKRVQEFFSKIDAACLYSNTSTQFSDGGEFGLSSEIGISTQKLHVRGPFSHESLVTYKYIVSSEGAIRKN